MNIDKILKVLFLLALPLTGVKSQSLEEAFRLPSDEAKPLMIWQWMDGLVTENGITADLEAYKEAGIGGVQQFLVGGPRQTLVSDSTNAIGTASWERLMQHAISECERLGLSFGTHNCPGWSSSAFPAVLPEYSMQKLVWSMTAIDSKTKRGRKIVLERPKINRQYDYYRDIAVVAMPDADSVDIKSIFIISDKMGNDGVLNWRAPKGEWRIYRFGHTANGKTNESTAPTGGVGLECDKMSREAVERYWSSYPSMLLKLAAGNVGKTFQRIEIDSYEAGGQEWTILMPEEFKKRRGYDILPWLPAIAGVTIQNREATQRFKNDWQAMVTDLFAENYYGYMSQLVHRHQGLRLLVQPYGTGASKPFNPIHTGKVVSQLAIDDPICAEFWTKPETWGWPDVPRVVSAARKAGHEIVYAEGFTCWPLHAWKDAPNDLKAVADRAFCLGINALMLHAGAQNPWPDVKPGMTFGIWGTQWTSGQTWWQSGGAKELFSYFTHCQALLQRGKYVDDYRSEQQSLQVDSECIQWIHRQEEDTDIFFIANSADSAVMATITIDLSGKVPEIWNPEKVSIKDAKAWKSDGTKTRIALNLTEREALFVVFRRASDTMEPGLMMLHEPEVMETTRVMSSWAVCFPEGWGALSQTNFDELIPWNESKCKGIKYFSGTARYSNKVYLERIDTASRYILDLGEVKNLAVVRVNGQLCGHLWRPPFRVDITAALCKGDNLLEIDVTNLWVNRFIGDEQEDDDIEWSEPFRYGYAPDTPAVGRYMKRVPKWLSKGLPRPSKGRKAVGSFKFFEKDDELLPSGLLGPVLIERQSVHVQSR